MNQIKGVDELISVLTRDGRHPFTLFVGSMISCTPPARAPSVQEILKSLRDELLESLGNAEELRTRVEAALDDQAARDRLMAVPFESLWERVARVTGADFAAATLKRLCAGGAPNVNHEAIGYLVRLGRIQTILTTNYDEYLEAAISERKSDEWGYEAFSPEHRMVLNGQSPASLDCADFKLIKLHGTLSHKETMAFMFPQIAAGFSEKTASALSELLTPNPVLFAGYGCNDWDLRVVLRAPIHSIWATRKELWETVDERCRSVAEYHEKVAWYRHNLIGNAKRSVLVQIASRFGWECPESPEDGFEATQRHKVVAELEPEAKMEILAELLDSLALRVASDVFAEVAKLHRSKAASQRRAEIGAYVAISHDMSTGKQAARGLELLQRNDWTLDEQVIILSQLAFAHLMNASAIPALRWTMCALKMVRRLEREVGPRRLLERDPASLHSDDRSVVAAIAKARTVVAHNLLRLAWFHVPGTLGRAARIGRTLGIRWFLALIARRVLNSNRPWVAASGDLVAQGNLNRELAHALCLTGRSEEALKSAVEAEAALEWGHWYQLQANAIRTRGWVRLHMGGRAQKDMRQAQQAFAEAVELANEYAREKGEMIHDRIKALLELKRIASLTGNPFQWEELLDTDLASMKDRDPAAYERYRAISDSPPRSREPLG